MHPIQGEMLARTATDDVERLTALRRRSGIEPRDGWRSRLGQALVRAGCRLQTADEPATTPALGACGLAAA